MKAERGGELAGRPLGCRSRRRCCGRRRHGGLGHLDAQRILIELLHSSRAELVGLGVDDVRVAEILLVDDAQQRRRHLPLLPLDRILLTTANTKQQEQTDIGSSENPYST